MKFTLLGVRLNVVRYRSYRYLCEKCGHVFVPCEYPIGKGRLHLGHNFVSWIIYEHIENKQPIERIANSCRELFHLNICSETINRCKKYFLRYYEGLYENIISRIITSAVLYVDETPFSLQFEKGYVWVFTNGKDVVSIYKQTRESGFLKDFLKGFNGILVTDFYNGYDAIDCPQQKCLIHFIRNLNSDLIRNPFNEEFKKLAKSFTQILQRIVKTVDCHGLKKYFLKKHLKHVKEFMATVSSSTFQTEIAQQYQNRIRKNRDRMFQFLGYDNVSWNNTNAEHAIKMLATHVNKDVNAYRATTIADTLKVVSIYQTCKYRDVRFLKFLLSKRKEIK